MARVTPECLAAIAAGEKTMIRTVAGEEREVCPHGAPGDRIVLTAPSDPVGIPAAIESIRLEPLQAIPEEDLAREGGFPSREAFGAWWSSVHARPGTKWEDDPVVWVVGLRRL